MAWANTAKPISTTQHSSEMFRKNHFDRQLTKRTVNSVGSDGGIGKPVSLFFTGTQGHLSHRINLFDLPYTLPSIKEGAYRQKISVKQPHSQISVFGIIGLVPTPKLFLGKVFRLNCRKVGSPVMKQHLTNDLRP